MKKVYVFDMNNEFIKIGISVDVKKRASSISSSSGYAVLRHYESALMSDDDARAIERDLHAHFKTYRALGEFFKITFEEACDELNKRAELNKLKTAVPVNLKRAVFPAVAFSELFFWRRLSSGSMLIPTLSPAKKNISAGAWRRLWR